MSRYAADPTRIAAGDHTITITPGPNYTVTVTCTCGHDFHPHGLPLTRQWANDTVQSHRHGHKYGHILEAVAA